MQLNFLKYIPQYKIGNRNIRGVLYNLCHFCDNLQSDFLFVTVKNAQKYYYENCVTYDICDGVPGKTAKSTILTL